MKVNKIRFSVIILFLVFFFNYELKSEIIILSGCDDKQDEFLKNEYILNLDDLLMTRNYVYKDKTYKKYRINDLSVKKSNSYIRGIYKENGKILTHKHGYPQFYTQILFETEKPEVYMKTVLNNEEGVTKISNCKKIEKFKKES